MEEIVDGQVARPIVTFPTVHGVRICASFEMTLMYIYRTWKYLWWQGTSVSTISIIVAYNFHYKMFSPWWFIRSKAWAFRSLPSAWMSRYLVPVKRIESGNQSSGIIYHAFWSSCLYCRSGSSNRMYPPRKHLEQIFAWKTNTKNGKWDINH